MTVSLPTSGGTSQGFQLAVLTQSGNAQAGTLAAGPTPAGASFPTDQEVTQGTIQYIADSAEANSWTFSWTPPATDAGTVVLYVTGGNHNTNYENSYTITSTGSGGGGSTPATLAAAPTSLTFTVNGAEPASQTSSITINPTTAATTVTTSVSPANSWLSAVPPSGSVGPLTVTVSVNAATLAAGTQTGSVTITAPSSSGITALTIPVTVNVTTPIPPATTPPTLNLSSTGLNFTATAGGSNPAAQSVMVTASNGSAVTFNDAPTSTGNWLTVGGSTGTGTGTTSASESIGVVLTGLAAGTYHASVAFTSSGVSNSPVTLPVTLTVNPSTPPTTTTGETFSLAVVDRLAGGDWLLLDGSGSVNSSGTPSGSGYFTRFRSMSTREGGGGSTTTIVSSGTWTPTSMTSFTPVSGSSTGGTLVLQVQLPHSLCPSTSSTSPPPCTGTLTITSNSTSSGVNLAINGGSAFNSVGIGTESITQRNSGGGGGGTGTGGGGTPDN